MDHATRQQAYRRGLLAAIAASVIGFLIYFGIGFFTGFRVGIILIGVGGIAGAAASSSAGLEDKRVGWTAAITVFFVGALLQFCMGFLIVPQAVNSVIGSEDQMGEVVLQEMIAAGEVPGEDAVQLLEAMTQYESLREFNGDSARHYHEAKKRAFNMTEAEQRSLVKPLVEANVQNLSFAEKHFADPLAYLWLLFGAVAAFRFGNGKNTF